MSERRKKPGAAIVKRTRALSYGALGLAVVAVLYLLLSSSGGSKSYLIRAEFKELDGVIPNSTVKENGLAVGTVKTEQPTHHGTAMVTISIDPAAAPIGKGASMQIRPSDLLGERYAQLTPGDLKHPQPSNSFIPVTNTTTPVDLDQILNGIDANTQMRLRILINEAGIALQGRGADFNKLLGELPPNLGQAQQLLGQVAQQNVALKNMISEGDQITAVVNHKRDDMGRAITAAESALGSVASRQAQLGQTMQNAPGALVQLRSTLNQVGSASQAILPAAADLQQTAPPLTATLRELPAFRNSANATLATAQRVAPSITRLGLQAQGPVRALRPTARKLDVISRQAQPITTELNTRGMRDTLWFVQNWTLALAGRDSLSHFVGANLQIDPSILINTADSYLNGLGLPSLNAAGPKGARKTAARKTAAAKSAAGASQSPAASSKPPAGLGSLNLGSVMGKVNSTVHGALGGLSSLLHPTSNKASSLLGGLTGGALHQATAQKHPPSAGPSQGAGNVKRLLSYLLGQ